MIPGKKNKILVVKKRAETAHMFKKSSEPGAWIPVQ